MGRSKIGPEGSARDDGVVVIKARDTSNVAVGWEASVHSLAYEPRGGATTTSQPLIPLHSHKPKLPMIIAIG